MRWFRTSRFQSERESRGTKSNPVLPVFDFVLLTFDSILTTFDSVLLTFDSVWMTFDSMHIASNVAGKTRDENRKQGMRKHPKL